MSERVARITRTGGPEVIEWVDVDLPPPGPGEVRMRHHAVGLNYIDTYHRSGVYPVDLPAGLGSEAAGVVEAVGEGVDGLKVGDRVGTFGPSRGAYATARNVAANQLFRLPDDVDDRTAAAMLLKGCTVEALVDRCARVQAGQTVLVWAAAGVWAGTAVVAPSASQPAIAARVDFVFMGLEEECASAVRVGADGAGEMTKPPVSDASRARRRVPASRRSSASRGG
jgi:NADPH2:quinone reductase